jgi:hypothetical protein
MHNEHFCKPFGNIRHVGNGRVLPLAGPRAASWRALMYPMRENEFENIV